MALEKTGEILRAADQASTGVLAFNCIDYSTIKCVIAAANELGKPAICMLHPDHERSSVLNLEGFASIVKSLAATVAVPIGLHLDHSDDHAYIEKAMRCGFTSVMYDGSVLPLEENILQTKKMVQLAKTYGVDVEAEIGRVGLASDRQQAQDSLLSTPDITAKFAAETGASSIAVAIGNAHGFYTSRPRLDIVRLESIDAATDTPLVLHGGSGIPDDQMADAFRKGINKLNVGTEYLWLWNDSMTKYTVDKHTEPWDVPSKVQGDLMEYLLQKLQLTTL